MCSDCEEPATTVDFVVELSQVVAGFRQGSKNLGFLKPNLVGFLGFSRVFKFQCAVLDAIHIK